MNRGRGRRSWSCWAWWKEWNVLRRVNYDALNSISTLNYSYSLNRTQYLIHILKTEIFPIHCKGIDLKDLLTVFPAKVTSLPQKYLGLPLHFNRLRNVHLEPLIDKVHFRLPGWKGKNIATAGRWLLPSPPSPQLPHST